MPWRNLPSVMAPLSPAPSLAPGARSLSSAPGAPPSCLTLGCHQPASLHGLCDYHWERQRDMRDDIEEERC